MANIDPIFTRLASTSDDGTATTSSAMALQLLTATGDMTGVSTNHKLVWTADPANGGYIERLRFKAEGTNTASVARVFINNGGVNTSAANNSLYGEISLPAITAILTAATIDLDYWMNIALDPGFRIFVGLGTTVAAGWRCVGVGGKY